jgi:hypothetical protein
MFLSWVVCVPHVQTMDFGSSSATWVRAAQPAKAKPTSVVPISVVNYPPVGHTRQKEPCKQKTIQWIQELPVGDSSPSSASSTLPTLPVREWRFTASVGVITRT